MTSSAVALIHSPLTSAEAWGEVPSLLRDNGFTVAVPEVLDDDGPPHSTRFIARVALQLADDVGTQPLVLVGHGDAGPLLPQIGFARSSAATPVTGYVFVDAELPRSARTSSRIDLLRLSDPQAADILEAKLLAGDRVPNWSEADLAGVLPTLQQRALLLAGLRPRGLDYYRESLPLAEDWPDARCGYLRLSAEHAWHAQTAHHRGWQVRELDLHHFAALTHSLAVATELSSMMEHL